MSGESGWPDGGGGPLYNLPSPSVAAINALAAQIHERLDQISLRLDYIVARLDNVEATVQEGGCVYGGD